MNTKPRYAGLARSIAGLCTLVVLSQAAAQEQFDRGQALYEDHCRSCHESWAHTREGRHVRTISELRARTAAWSVHSRLDWTAEDVNDVADYLNRAFYHLEETP